MGRVIRADVSDAGFSVSGTSVRDAPQAITASDVEEPEKLAQMLTQIRKDISATRKAADGAWVEFEDIVVGVSGASVSLAHHMGGRVRWSVVDVDDNAALNGVSIKKDPTNTTDDVLVLKSYVALTVTIRVEKVVG